MSEQIEARASAALSSGQRTKITERVAVVGAAASVYGLGFSSSFLSPLLLPSMLEERGLGSFSAGMLLSAELICTAIFTLLLTKRVAAIGPRASALIGASVLIVCQALSAVSLNLEIFVVLRLICGLSASLCICAGNLMVVNQLNPDRAAAISLALSSLAYSALYPFAMAYMEGNTAGGFIVQIGWSLVLSPLLLLLPAHVRDGATQADVCKSASVNVRIKEKILISSAFFIYIVWATAPYAFGWTFASSAGVSYEGYGYVMSLASLTCILAAWFVTRIGNRYGRILPFLIALVVSAGSSMIFFQTANARWSMASLAVVLTGYNFVLPFLICYCSSRDPSGSLANSASSTWLVGGAIAPAFVGAMIEHLDVLTLSMTYPFAYVLVLGLFALALRVIRP